MNDVVEKKILLLCHYYPGVAGAITDHIHAFVKHSNNEYFILSNLGDLPDWLDLSRFDGLVLHYSLIACYDNYVSPNARKRIRDFSGFKAAFVQDDYRWINDTVTALAYMGIHALFPLAGLDIINEVYSPEKLPNVRKEPVHAGYVPQELVTVPVRPIRERTIDVGYRARKLPAWMGSHTLQKWQIAETFLNDSAHFGLKVDISCREEDRIYGDDWVSFVSNCKATLGTESGASVCDFTGDIQRNVEGHLAKYPDTDFYTLRDLYFRDEDCKFMMNVISPRCFESAALRTLMVLYEGHYSGVLVPWRHYVPLKRDHSNMDEVVRILQSPDEAQKIVDLAYEEIAENENYSYSAMVKLVDRVMEEEWSESIAHCQNGYSQEEFEWFRRHTDLSLGQRLSPRYEMTFFSPQANSCGNAKLNKISPYTHFSMKANKIEIPLDLNRSAKIIAIRWNTDVTLAPINIELHWLRNGKIVAVQSMPNTKQKAFHLIEMISKSPKADLLQILVRDSLDPKIVTPVGVAVIWYEGSMWLKKAKIVLFQVWGVMPEGIRRVLRPAVRALR